MNQREEHVLETIVQRHNEVFIAYTNLLTLNDSLTQEVNNLRTALADAYRELAELKGLPPETPGEQDLEKAILYK